MTEDLERAAQYRAQAADFLQKAEEETDTDYKATWLEMVALYKSMAEQIEEIHRRGDVRRA